MATSPSVTRLQFFKYDGAEHWGADLRLLGEDAHGIWLGAGRGVGYEHPTKPYDAASAPVHVVLVPRDDWYVATFNATPGGRSRTVEVYVDITTPATVAEGEIFALDLDLDVIRRTGGTVEIDDEDEFADHQVSMAYPARVVAAAREAADRVAALVRDGAAPFDGAHERWLAKVR